LEGLNAIDEELLIKLMDDDSPELRKHAIWISEKFLYSPSEKLKTRLIKMKDDENYAVREQLVLSFNKSGDEELKSVAKKILSAGTDTGMFSALESTFAKNVETKKYGSKLVALKNADRKRVMNGAVIFSSICASCHGSEGQGVPTQIAPPLVSKFKLIEKKEEVIKILLHGLSGPVDGKTYTDNMAPMNANDDEWIASVLSYVRFDLCMRSFPNMPEKYLNGVMVRPEDVLKIRNENKGRTKPWTWAELVKKEIQKPN
jgi:mono/diheme cytochrome c family protein